MASVPRDFSDRTVLILGGTSGIGLAAAEDFQRRGARVIVTGKNAAQVETAGRALGAGGVVLVSDVTSEADRVALRERVASEWVGIDVLIYNAGVASQQPFREVTEEEFDRVMDVNFKGAVFSMKELSPFVRTGGKIVLIASAAHLVGVPGLSVYGASKGAIRTLARTLAAEFLPRNICVNAVCPGPVQTGIFASLGVAPAKANRLAHGLAGLTPMKRFGTLDEVAACIVFLSSEGAGYITGAELTPDGGWSNL